MFTPPPRFELCDLQRKEQLGILKVSIGEISFIQVSHIPIHEKFQFKSFMEITRLSTFLGRLLICMWIIENIFRLFIYTCPL